MVASSIYSNKCLIECNWRNELLCLILLLINILVLVEDLIICVNNQVLTDDYYFNDLQSIEDYCVYRIDTSSIHESHQQLFLNVVKEIFKDINCFDSTKYTCTICGDKVHAFDACPQLMNNEMKDAYTQR